MQIAKTQRPQQPQKGLFFVCFPTFKMHCITKWFHILSSIPTLCFVYVSEKSILWRTDALTPAHARSHSRAHALTRAHSFSRAKSQWPLWCASCPLQTSVFIAVAVFVKLKHREENFLTWVSILDTNALRFYVERALLPHASRCFSWWGTRWDFFHTCAQF